jgi:hypothetical protein
MTRVDGEVWIEVHPPIDEQGQTTAVSLQDFESRLDDLLGTAEVAINWDIAIRALGEASGIPVMIGLELVPQLPPVDPATVPSGDAPIDKPT